MQVLATGVELAVETTCLSKEVKAFQPGDQVRRAMFSGAEEDAVIVRNDSATHATITLLEGSRATYSSDLFRLRLIKSAGATGNVSESPTVQALNIAKLERMFKDRVTFNSKLSNVKPNPHAAPGSALYSRFLQAIATAPHKELDVYVHGSHESNVDSILRESLTISNHGGRFWFTKNINTAQRYVR